MLTTTPESEKGIKEAQDWSDRLDHIAKYYSLVTSHTDGMRLAFEKLLNFLRTFGCVTNNETWEVDPELCNVILAYEGHLQFFWTATMRGKDAPFMCGGLNYHGITDDGHLKLIESGAYEGRLSDITGDFRSCSWSTNT